MGRKARRRPERRPSPEERRALEERSCRSKTRYHDQRAALEARDRVRLEHGHDKGIYRCEFCGGWHIGGRGIEG